MKPRTQAILPWVEGPAVLDVGCAGHVPRPGSPYWLHGVLRERFADVVGLDIEAENLAALRRAGFDELYLAGAEDFRLPRKFSTIVAGELIEHLSNPGKFLRRCREHLAPGGRLVLTTPNAFAMFNLLYALFKYPKTCQNGQHTCWYCPRTLHQLVARHGFRVAHWELIEDFIPGSGSRPYRVFASLISALGPLLPKWVRTNAMLFVLEADENLGGDSHVLSIPDWPKQERPPSRYAHYRARGCERHAPGRRAEAC